MPCARSSTRCRRGSVSCATTASIAWSLGYLGIAASLIGVMGAIGPGFATDILRLRPQDFFFVMGPAGLGAVMGILFLNAYGKGIPRRLLIDLGLVAMGITLIGLALVKPITVLLAPAFGRSRTTCPRRSRRSSRSSRWWW